MVTLGPYDPRERTLYVVFRHSTQDPSAGPRLEAYRPGEVVHDLVAPFELEAFRSHSYAEARAFLTAFLVMER